MSSTLDRLRSVTRFLLADGRAGRGLAPLPAPAPMARALERIGSPLTDERDREDARAVIAEWVLRPRAA